MKNLCKIDYNNETKQFSTIINGNLVCTGTREECCAAGLMGGFKSAQLRYTDAARTITAFPRYKRYLARQAAGKSLNKYDLQFIEKYGKIFSQTDES